MDDPWKLGSFVGAAVSLFGAAVTWTRSVQVQKEQGRTNIQSMLNKAIELAITYPHLEQDAYCSAWPEPPGDGDQRERYDNYCCFVFNIIDQAWSLERKKPKRVEMLVPVREHAWRHHRWWNTEDANDSGYDLDFVRYVDDVIVAEATRRGPKP